MDAMLAELTPAQITEWRAFLGESDDADDWRQAAMIASAICNGFGEVSAAFGGQPAPVEEDDLIPRWKFKGDVSAKVARLIRSSMDSDAISAALQATFGKPNG